MLSPFEDMEVLEDWKNWKMKHGYNKFEFCEADEALDFIEEEYAEVYPEEEDQDQIFTDISLYEEDFDNKKEELLEAIKGLDEETKMAIYNEYEESNYGDKVFQMEELNEMWGMMEEGYMPLDLAFAINNGNFNPYHDYFTYDGCGMHSYDDIDDLPDWEDLAEEAVYRMPETLKYAIDKAQYEEAV